MVNELTRLLVLRIKQAYRENGVRMPPQFGKNAIKIFTLVDNLRNSKLIVEPSTLRAWRVRGCTPLSSGAGSSSEVGQKRPHEEQEDDARRTSPRKLGPPGEDWPSSEEEEGEREGEEEEAEAEQLQQGSPQKPIEI